MSRKNDPKKSDGGGVMGAGFIETAPPNYGLDHEGWIRAKRRRERIEANPPTPQERAIAGLKNSQAQRQRYHSASISLPKFSWDVEEAASR